MQVAKWGNSLAVRLPVAVVEALDLKEGDEIELHVADTRHPGVARKPGRQELLRRLRAFRGRLPPDFKFDRDEANPASFFDSNVFSILHRAKHQKQIRRRRRSPPVVPSAYRFSMRSPTSLIGRC